MITNRNGWLQRLKDRIKGGQRVRWEFYHDLPANRVIAGRLWYVWDYANPNRGGVPWPQEYRHAGAVAVCHVPPEEMTEDDRAYEIKCARDRVNLFGQAVADGVEGASDMLTDAMQEMMDLQSAD